MFKYILALLLISGINFIVTIEFLTRIVEKKHTEIFVLAEKSYFLGCVNSLSLMSLPDEDVLVICNAETQNYSQLLNDYSSLKD